MADFEDDGDNDRPWMGVAIPFSIVVAIVLCCVVVFCHRRNLKMQRNGVALDHQGHMALRRDMYPNAYNGGGYYSSNRGFRDQHMQPQTRPRVANRWAWTTTARAAAQARAEGLDEHGQAPPPYMRYDNPQDKMATETRAVEEHIEMDDMAVSPPAPAHIRRESSTASPPSASAGLSPSQAGSSATSASRPLTLPPAYNDVTTPKRPN